MTDARAGTPTAGLDARARVVDVANRLGERFLRWLDRYFAKHSLVGDRAFFAVDEFPWVREVEARWPAIRAELDEVLRDVDHLPNFQDISTDQYRITQDDRWKTFFLLGYGFRVDEHLARCPETAKALAEIPGITTAMFSIFAPHKRIPPHVGPYKGVLRYHLGLRVPEPRDACGITVRGETRHWDEGAQPHLRRRLGARGVERHRRHPRGAVRRLHPAHAGPGEVAQRRGAEGDRLLTVRAGRQGPAPGLGEARFERAADAAA